MRSVRKPCSEIAWLHAVSIAEQLPRHGIPSVLIPVKCMGTRMLLLAVKPGPATEQRSRVPSWDVAMKGLYGTSCDCWAYLKGSR